MANKADFVARAQQFGVQLREQYNAARAIVAEYNAAGGSSALVDADFETVRGEPFTKAQFIDYVATLQAIIALYEAGHLTNIQRVAA